MFGKLSTIHALSTEQIETFSFAAFLGGDTSKVKCYCTINLNSKCKSGSEEGAREKTLL